MDRLGLIIKDLRKSKRLSQTEFGKLVGVSTQSVSEWETGKARPDIRRLQLIAEVLDTDVNTLIETAPNQIEAEGKIKHIQIDRTKTKNLPLISIRGQANVIENSLEGCQLHFIEDYYQLYLPDVELDEKKHVIIEIEGDSMEPDIKNRAKVLGESIPQINIKYESNAVYAVLFANRFVVKRIKSNDIIEKGRLILHSDNQRYGPMTIEAVDLKCIWKVLRIIDSPVY